MIGFKIKRKNARRIGVGLVIIGAAMALGIVPTIVVGIGLAVLWVTR